MVVPTKPDVLEDTSTFVNVWFDDKPHGSAPSKDSDKGHFYDQWLHQASAKHSSPELFGANALRRLYPDHSLVMSADYQLNLLAFPGAYAIPLETTPLITNVVFRPLARRLGSTPGVLVDQVLFGSFRLAWDKYEFTIYIVTWPLGFGGSSTQNFILHEGPEDPARSLLLAAGIWQGQLHDEIWVFDQFWQKSHELWLEVQKANWKDVILKDEFKKALQKDVYGFFTSEAVYKQLAIPWKRGLILHGPPGNGKTISIKAIMQTCDAQGFAPLYIKSFQSWMGEEGAMTEVFTKARQMSPCVVILEDLDSLINDRNRSFFLNQLDGLEGNDGLLVIGTTNHFERLDPGLSTRPSRFDRKFLFDDPDRDERALYAIYWQGKLKNNKDISFPDPLVDEVADSTDGFSFAYLKEAFVSSLVTLAGYEGDDKPTFAVVLRDEIEALRKQMDKSSIKKSNNPSEDSYGVRASNDMPVRPKNTSDNGRDVRALLDALSDSIARSDIRPSRMFETRNHQRQSQSDVQDGRDVRVLLDAVSDSLSRNNIRPSRVFDTHNQAPAHNRTLPSTASDGAQRDFRVLLDGIYSQGQGDILADRIYQAHRPAAASSVVPPAPWDRPISIGMEGTLNRDNQYAVDLPRNTGPGDRYGADLA